ncbi:MAG: hypothetical protein ACOCXJ_05270 [Planctomycetota bacterium]
MVADEIRGQFRAIVEQMQAQGVQLRGEHGSHLLYGACCLCPGADTLGKIKKPQRIVRLNPAHHRFVIHRDKGIQQGENASIQLDGVPWLVFTGTQ